jgi:hypothetical protein
MSDFENHYKTLLSENREECGVCFSPQPLEASSLETDMTDMEIAIQSLKNKKSPGPGMITNELIKCGPCSLKNRRMNLFNRCIISQKTR